MLLVGGRRTGKSSKDARTAELITALHDRGKVMFTDVVVPLNKAMQDSTYLQPHAIDDFC